MNSTIYMINFLRILQRLNSDTKTHRFSLRLFIFNPYGVGRYSIPFPQVSPGAIHIQPLRGWQVFDTFSLGFTWGYSYSTPLGLAGIRYLFPRFHLGLFIFNPYGVGRYSIPFPQVSPGAIHIQPLWGWQVFDTFSPGFTWGYSYSTPLGLTHSPTFPQVAPGAIHIQPLRG